MNNDVELIPVKGVLPSVQVQSDVVVYVPLASKTSPGIVQIGDGLNINNGVVSVVPIDVPIMSISKNGTLIVPDENKNVNIVIDKSDVGLSNVDNTSDLDKPISNATQQAINNVENDVNGLSNRIDALSQTGVHSINGKTGNVVLKNSDLENDTNYATEQYVQENGGKIDKIVLNDNEQEIINKIVTLTIDKTTVGLSNVDNTSDKNKPISDATKQALDTKMDKSGGIFTGNVGVQGNLSVSGTITTKDTETLKVQDNVIVTNANKIDLLDLSGLAINKNDTQTYGIMYDAVDDSVKLGLGSIDSNGKFTFNEGEGSPVATRSDSSSLTDNHLIKWDATNNKLVDSGYSAEDKLDKISTSSTYQRAYIVDTDGTQNSIAVSITSTAPNESLIKRDKWGCAEVDTPGYSDVGKRIVNQEYVKTHFYTKTDDIKHRNIYTGTIYNWLHDETDKTEDAHSKIDFTPYSTEILTTTKDNESARIELGADPRTTPTVSESEAYIDISIGKPNDYSTGITLSNNYQEVFGDGISLYTYQNQLTDARILTLSANGLFISEGLELNTETQTAQLKNKKEISPNTIRYDIEQTLTDEQKAQARTNIGAGTGGFSGSYPDLNQKPILNTSNTTSQTAQADETIDGTINLHKVSKTGALADTIQDSTHRTVTDTEKQTWNNKSDFNGSFNSLTDVPQASTGVAGVIQIATDNEAETGTNTTKAVNPKQLKTAIDGLGSVFTLKGSVENVGALPSTGNEIGDVYYVVSENVGYIWLNDGTTNRWEQLGLPIDLSGYVQFTDIINTLNSTASDKPLSAMQGKVLNDQLNSLATQLETANTNISTLQTKALVKPTSSPSTTELVGVNNQNMQTMIELGNGLVLSNDVLSIQLNDTLAPYVSYAVSQSLTDEQKALARANIGAGTGSGTGGGTTVTVGGVAQDTWDADSKVNTKVGTNSITINDSDITLVSAKETAEVGLTIGNDATLACYGTNTADHIQLTTDKGTTIHHEEWDNSANNLVKSDLLVQDVQIMAKSEFTNEDSTITTGNMAVFQGMISIGSQTSGQNSLMLLQPSAIEIGHTKGDAVHKILANENSIGIYDTVVVDGNTLQGIVNTSAGGVAIQASSGTSGGGIIVQPNTIEISTPKLTYNGNEVATTLYVDNLILTTLNTAV